MNYQVKTIDVNAKSWFDKVNGNSYFAGTYTLNFGQENATFFVLPFQYGYGDYYLQKALEELKEMELINTTSTHELREAGIIVRYNIEKNCKKAELTKFK